MAVMAVEVRASLYVLAVLCSVLAEHSPQGRRGLSCVNDFINNVSCTWQRSAAVAPGADCRVLCTKTAWDMRDFKPTEKNLTESCELKRHDNAASGCSCVFRNEKFNAYSDLPCIRVECSGALMEQLTQYSPYHHIKMHPPGVPNASSSANETRLWWSRGEPSSDLLSSLHFQVQIKQESELWNRSSSLITAEPELSIPAGRLTGVLRVRVRVRPVVTGSHWSDWSPTASFSQESPLGQTSMIIRGVMFSLGIVIVMLVLYRSCAIKRLLKGKPLPNPSTYFHSLHSEHGGNLKKWLNPPSASEPFFAAPPCDRFSPVDVCSTDGEGPSTSSTSCTFPSSGSCTFPSSGSSGSTSALLHLGSHPSAGSDTSGVVDNSSSPPSSSSTSSTSTSSSSSSSSSCFSNMGYFMSSSSGSSTRTDHNPAYFTYQEDFHNVHDSLSLHPSLHPSFPPFSTYESLKREPQSPDSGFGIGKDDEDKRVAVVVEDEASDGDPDPPLLILPLHRPAQMCPTSSAPPPLNTPTLISSDRQQVEVDVAAAGGGPAARPPDGAVCRSSSMRVEPCRTGYLTLKELQATFSNKSI